MFCKSCGNKLDDDALFCMNCGVKVADDTSSKYCAYCGNELEDDAAFCMNCGNRVNEEQAQTATENKVESESVREGDLETKDSQITTTETTNLAKENVEESLQNEEPVTDTISNTDVQTDDDSQEKETVTAPVLTEKPQKETVEQSELKLEFKDTYVNGKRFVYIDDSSKLFCPKCHKRADVNATMCSNCNANFVISSKSSSESEVSWQVQKIDFENTGEKSTYSTTNSSTRDNGKNYGLLIAVIFIVVAIFAGLSLSENNKKSVQTSTSNGVSNTNTFNFDHLKPYTFKSNDGSYEYDCYSLSKGTLSSLWNNPPRYFTYNTKKYEVDNRNIDYDDEDYDGDYNVIIYWGDYDGTYYHFLGVEIINGDKGMWLWKM